MFLSLDNLDLGCFSEWKFRDTFGAKLGNGSALFATNVGGNMGGAPLNTHAFETAQIQADVA